ncbi:GNAT family N-acetyltransferase [Sphingomonas colocasiae]|uniref:GNAT family N-acetyltransferase n=1 Tax=Sphingomonas colocasiae TaxID=1848973 RepID=A0ABS7PIQ3_9SPHN|nr:GNAT family N-acetyltransferase [Sphingomonas colocasiae]MBY8821181.1 GNAT family N-acetyltransferase [Sphingomonas colocasiae]
MTVTAFAIRAATPADLETLHPVIERAYRGGGERPGWTHEAELLEGQRTDITTLRAILDMPDTQLLVAEDNGAIAGCVQITDRGDERCYLGLLCVDPRLQATGLGRRLLAEAEERAQARFGSLVVEMTVIEARAELIAYYERRGYRATGERRDFPISLTPPLFMTVLEKPLR